MPFYEYECQNCKFYTELLQKVTDAPLKKCPSCGKSAMKKLVSAPVFRLKGGGWYETDFKGDKENKRNLAVDKEPESASDSKAAKSDTAAADSKSTSESKPAEAKASSEGSSSSRASSGSRASSSASRKASPSRVSASKARAKPASKAKAKKRARR
jgi:putative FmdB family regulatory protein